MKAIFDTKKKKERNEETQTVSQNVHFLSVLTHFISRYFAKKKI